MRVIATCMRVATRIGRSSGCRVSRHDRPVHACWRMRSHHVAGGMQRHRRRHPRHGHKHEPGHGAQRPKSARAMKVAQ